MSKFSKKTLFAIPALTVCTLFGGAGTASAVGIEAPGSGCAGAERVTLAAGQSLDVEPGAYGIELAVEDPGFLLAEAYTLSPGAGEPQVNLQGVGSAGADWLAGRLVPIRKGTYCLGVGSRSPRETLGRTRLTLALADPAFGTKDGDDPVPEPDMPDDGIDGVLQTVSQDPAAANKSTRLQGGHPGEADFRKGEVPFLTSMTPAYGTGKDGDDPVPEPDMPDDGIDGVLFTGSGFPTVLAAKDGESPVPDPDMPDDGIDGVLIRGGAILAESHSIARQMGLCTSSGEASGNLACASALPLDHTADGRLDVEDIDTFTFELAERATVALLVEGSASWMTLSDAKAGTVDTWGGGGSGEIVRTLAPGRYWVRLGAEAGIAGPYSIASKRLARR